MTSYGHDLQFGVFVSPVAEPAQHAAELAVVAEAAGLDLVTFQDHPYNPQFLDTWTLIAYAASVTETIHLAGNVLNLPLRDPVELARATATLDRLSGGRIELGIGAGAMWDGIGAMGGKKLSAGQSIEALGEGIELIRELWKADEPTSVSLEGTHYRVEATTRGPAPAHEIGIWVGAYKPRILRLTGRLADGWLPSLGYLPEGPSQSRGNERGDRRGGHWGGSAAERYPAHAQYQRAVPATGTWHVPGSSGDLGAADRRAGAGIRDFDLHPGQRRSAEHRLVRHGGRTDGTGAGR